MMRYLYRTVAAWIAAAVLFSLPVRAAIPVSARSAVLLDAASGRVLWEKDGEEQSLIASTTKIMTGLLIAEDCELKAQIQVPEEAVGIEGSSLYLKQGESISVETLLYGLMLQSGNDAAAALAIHHSGSMEAFAQAMNVRAKQLGLWNTHYVNPHGLDSEGHYSTALDLARLTACAMDNPVFHRIVSTKTVSRGDRTFVNHNRLLWQYEGAVGVKTGYTRSAGRILVSCAERNGRRLIAVTISAPDDWNDHRRLLDYGFSAYTERKLLRSGEICGTVSVIGGVKREAEVVSTEDFFYPAADEEEFQVRYVLPEFVYPPVLSGEQAGEAIFYQNETEIGRVPLIWRDTVMEEA